MNEFMFFIRKGSNSKETLSSADHEKFLKGCERYIGELKSEGKLLSAQPIEWTGKIIARKNGGWIDVPFTDPGEVIGGYYHILAENLEDAIAIARANPEFAYNPGTRIEVRPVKMKEQSTGFTYPSSQAKKTGTATTTR